MHKSRDKLYLVTVVELVASNSLSQLEEFLSAQIHFNEELEKHAIRSVLCWRAVPGRCRRTRSSLCVVAVLVRTSLCQRVT